MGTPPAPKEVVNGQETGPKYERGTGNPEKWSENEQWVADAISEKQAKMIYALGISVWESWGKPGGKYDEGKFLSLAFGIRDKNKLDKRQASSLIDNLNAEKALWQRA